MKKIKSFEEFAKQLNKIASQVITKQDLQEMITIVDVERQKGFITSTDPEGAAWKPLKTETIEKKKKGKGKSPTKPLINTGVMKKGITEIGDDYASLKLPASRSEKVYGDKSISDLHNEGNGKIPKREHWAIYKTAVDKIQKIVSNKMDKVIKQLFG